MSPTPPADAIATHAIPPRVLAVSVVRVVLVVAALLVLYAAVPVRTGPAAQNAVVWAGLLALAVFGVAFLTQIRRILGSRHPMLTGLEALVVVVTVFVVGFALVHVALSASDPAAYSEQLDKPAATYFTITVLSTVGFGDITPETTSARVVVSIQMLADLALIATTLRVIFGVARRVDRSRDQQAPDAADGPARGGT
jgi:voltage-gated potassium channel